MGFTKYPVKWGDKEKDSDRWHTCFHRGFRLEPIVMSTDRKMKNARQNGGFMRFKVDFDKNQCIVRAHSEEIKKEPSPPRKEKGLFTAKEAKEIFEIPKDVDIIPAISSRNNHIIEIRLGPVEYRR